MSENYFGTLPMGFGMALLQNRAAMEVYDQLPLNRQIEVINGTHSIRSKQEMQNYVASLVRLSEK